MQQCSATSSGSTWPMWWAVFRVRKRWVVAFGVYSGIESNTDQFYDSPYTVVSASQIRLLSAQFGANQVGWRTHGFKADFFAEMASALTMECVFLDGAAHPVSLAKLLPHKWRPLSADGCVRSLGRPC